MCVGAVPAEQMEIFTGGRSVVNTWPGPGLASRRDAIMAIIGEQCEHTFRSLVAAAPPRALWTPALLCTVQKMFLVNNEVCNLYFIAYQVWKIVPKWLKLIPLHIDYTACFNKISNGVADMKLGCRRKGHKGRVWTFVWCFSGKWKCTSFRSVGFKIFCIGQFYVMSHNKCVKLK